MINIIITYNSMQGSSFMVGVLPCFGLSLGGVVIDLQILNTKISDPALTRLKH